MKKESTFILMIIFIISCKNFQSPAEKFNETVEIIHTALINDDDIVFTGGEMLYMDKINTLIINSIMTDSLLISIDMDNNRISRLIPVGNGPGEFIHINLCQTISDSIILFQDMNSAVLYQLNVFSREIKKYFAYKESAYMKVVKMKSNYFATGVFNEGMFAVWNNDIFQNYQLLYPKDKTDDKQTASKAMAYQGKLLANESLQRLLFCAAKFSYFEIFKYEKDALSSIKKSYQGEYNYVTPSDGDSRIFAYPLENNREGYIDACATNDRIYLLYSGRSIEDSGIENHERACLSNLILVFDWEGNPIVRYKTDVDLLKMCVDERNNIIYAISFNPDPELVSFKL